MLLKFTTDVVPDCLDTFTSVKFMLC